jgi:hypothetical protein
LQPILQGIEKQCLLRCILLGNTQLSKLRVLADSSEIETKVVEEERSGAGKILRRLTAVLFVAGTENNCPEKQDADLFRLTAQEEVVS